MKFFTILAIISIVVFATLTSSVNGQSRAQIRKLNARDARALHEKFKSFTPDTPCEVNETACINGAFALCATIIENGELKDKYVLMSCGPTLQCCELPLVNKRGTSLTCDTEEDRLARLHQADNDL